MALKPINILGSDTKSLSRVFSVQTRLNCYYTIIPDGEKNLKISLKSTPGSTTFVYIDTDQLRGGIVAQNKLYILGDDTLYSINPDQTVDTLGTITNNTGRVEFAYNGYQILFVTGSDAWCFDINTAILSEVTTITSTNPATICFANGYFIVNDVGTNNFYISAFQDGTSWDPLDFEQASTTPDNIVALDNLHGVVVIFKEFSTEFWQDNGNSAFPFINLLVTQDWGLAGQFARSFIANGIAFVATNKTGQVQFMALEGLVPKRISDEAIENIVNGFSNVTSSQGFGYSINGHPFWEITFPSGNYTFLYDFLTGAFSKVQAGVELDGRNIYNQSFSFNNKVLVIPFNGGQVSEYSYNVYTENDNLIKFQATSKHIEIGGDEFTVDELWVDFEQGNGLLVGDYIDPQMLIECSKDNGKTFPQWQKVTLGRQGETYFPRAITYDWGSSRDFVFRFTITDPVPRNISRVCVQITPGTD